MRHGVLECALYCWHKTNSFARWCSILQSGYRFNSHQRFNQLKFLLLLPAIERLHLFHCCSYLQLKWTLFGCGKRTLDHSVMCPRRLTLYHTLHIFETAQAHHIIIFEYFLPPFCRTTRRNLETYFGENFQERGVMSFFLHSFRSFVHAQDVNLVNCEVEISTYGWASERTDF